MLKHKILLGTAALILGLGASLDARTDNSKFFTPPADLAKGLPADELYPQGRMFPFTFFSMGGGREDKTNAKYPDDIIHKLQARYRADGFSILGPNYELDERMLQDAETHDFKKVVYSISMPYDFHGKGQVEVDPEEVRKEIRRQVEAVMDNDRIAWWYLKPEELRWWRKNEMLFLQVAADTIRETDPKKRPVWMYDPAHRSANSLTKTGQHLDIVGKGTYTNYASMKNNRIWVKWSMDQQQKAIDALEHKPMNLLVPEMFQQPAPEELELIDDWVRHDVYLGLASGGKGLVVFSLRKRANFPAHEQYYQAYVDVAKQLLGEDGLGQVFLFGEDRTDIAVDVIEGPETVEMTFQSGGVKEPITYSTVNFANKAYGEHRYLFVINSANEPVTVAIGGMPFNSVMAQSLLDDAEPFLIAEGEFTRKLPALGVAIYKFSKPE